jgi:hypothetical protein
MPSLRRWPSLLAAALCVLAGDLAAQPTQTLSSRVARRLQDSGVTIRVDRAGIDTVLRVAGTRLRPGEMIVNVTGAQPTRVRPTLHIPARPPTEGTTVTPTRPSREETPERPKREETSTREERAREERAREERAREERAREERAREERAREERAREEKAREEDTREERAGDEVPVVVGGAVPPAPDDRVAYELSNYEIGVANAAGERLHVLIPLVEIEEGGLRFDPEANAYVGSILIGLLDKDNPASADSLGRDVVMQITGEVQSLEAVRLRTMNIPFQRVMLRVARPRGDSVRIRLRPTFDPRGGSDIWIPIRRATLSLHASPRRIAGFGLEIADLIVMNQDNDDSVPVALMSNLAKPSPSQVRATREGGVARIRSSGVGIDTVRLAGGAYQGFAVIQYGWPISFLLAALIGGLFGGVLNALSTKRESDPRTIAFLGGQGALTGIVGAILYAVGINVVGWAPSAEYGEALMFAVAFMTGLMGPRIFDRFLPKLSVGRKEDGGDTPPPAPPQAPAAPPASEPAAVG